MSRRGDRRPSEAAVRDNSMRSGDEGGDDLGYGQRYHTAMMDDGAQGDACDNVKWDPDSPSTGTPL